MGNKKSLKEKYPIGQKLRFHSGNFLGLDGVVEKVSENVPDAIFGFIIKVKLSNGETGYVEKSEHFMKIR